MEPILHRISGTADGLCVETGGPDGGSLSCDEEAAGPRGPIPQSYTAD